MTSKSEAMCVLLSIVWLVARAVKIGTQPCSSLDKYILPTATRLRHRSYAGLQYINDTATTRKTPGAWRAAAFFGNLATGCLAKPSDSASASASWRSPRVVTPPIEARRERPKLSNLYELVFDATTRRRRNRDHRDAAAAPRDPVRRPLEGLRRQVPAPILPQKTKQQKSSPRPGL